MGTIYQRGKTYWIKYYQDGKPYYESSHSKKKMVAKKLLDLREGEVSQGKIPGVLFEKVRFDDLAEDFLTDYRINKKKSLSRAEISVDKLSAHFSGFRVPKITTPKIKKYVESRLSEKAANATINRELAALKRMFNMGAQQTPPKVDRVPYIPMLKEKNTRKGFFEHGDFIAVREELPDFLKGFVTFAYKIGWRHSDIAALTWGQVDRHQWIVRLEVGESKNEEGSTVYLDAELQEIFKVQWKARKALKKALPYVFYNRFNTDKIKRFDKAWKTACKESKIGERYFHDFRRTAVRNMVRAGIPERVAMMISGHKTRSVFERYNIVSQQDLKEASKRQEKYLSEQMVTKTVTMPDFGNKKRVKKVS